MKKNCSCTDSNPIWKEEPPESRHRYRVECGVCEKFIKWGTELELISLIDSGVDGVVWKHGYEPPRNTLDAYFT